MGKLTLAEMASISEQPKPAKLTMAQRFLNMGIPLVELHGLRDDNKTCTCYSPNCKTPGKHPIGDDWTERAIRTSLAGLTESSNFGVLTGYQLPSGAYLFIWDVDTDGDKQGNQTMESLGWVLPETFTVQTGGGGRHYYFTSPDSIPALNRLPGVDVLGLDRQAVMPGCRSAKGEYTIISDVPIAEAPPEMLAWIADRVKENAEILIHEADEDEVLAERGTRAPIDEALAINTKDRSADTARIVSACARQGLSLSQTRKVVNRRPDLQARLANRNDDDVLRTWQKVKAKIRQEKLTPIELPAKEQPAGKPSLLSKLLTTYTLDNLPGVEPILNGVIYRDTLVWVDGAPGHGKSLAVLDMVGHIATNTPWSYKHPLERSGPVLYIHAEGARGLRQRVRAWEFKTDRRMDGVTFLPEPVQANNETDWNELIGLVQTLQPLVIVLDTQARMTVGMEENSALDMGKYIVAISRLREVCGSCVISVHHVTRGTSRLRGSTALEGAADTIISVSKVDTSITLECDKQKDAEPFEELNMMIMPMESGVTIGWETVTNSKKLSKECIKFWEEWWDLIESGWISPTNLMKALGKNESSVYRWIYALKAEGKAEMMEKGNGTRYRLLEPSPGEKWAWESSSQLPTGSAWELNASNSQNGHKSAGQGQSGSSHQ